MPHSSQIDSTRQPSPPSRIGIARRAGAYRVVAAEQIAPGSVILSIDGLFVDEPSRYSIQVSESLHVEPPREIQPDLEPNRCPWRFLNHSCAPNAALESTLQPGGSALRLVALRTIDQWEEISFDYNTNEYDMAEPFVCRCGNCQSRVVRGFRHLDALEQAMLRSRVAPHVRARLGEAG